MTSKFIDKNTIQIRTKEGHIYSLYCSGNVFDLYREFFKGNLSEVLVEDTAKIQLEKGGASEIHSR